MPFNYIIEHMEDDEVHAPTTLPEWVQLEYLHMRMLAGRDAAVHFTSLSASSSAALADVLDNPTKATPTPLEFVTDTGAAPLGLDHPDAGEPHAFAKASAHREGVLELMKQRGIPLERVCLLDPKAESELSPEDGDGTFDWYLFGGILGDDPPRDRTGELRKLGFPTRHLGPVQMTTDTAVGVTKKVVDDKVKLSNITYTDFPTIVFNAKESVEMPFRYIAINSKPLMPPGMRELLHRDLDRGFEF